MIFHLHGPHNFLDVQLSLVKNKNKTKTVYAFKCTQAIQVICLLYHTEKQIIIPDSTKRTQKTD